MDAKSLPKRKKSTGRLHERGFVAPNLTKRILYGKSLELALERTQYQSVDALVGRVQNAIEDVLLRDEDVPAPLLEALETAHSSIMAYWQNRDSSH